MTFLDGAREIGGELVELRRALHREPEVGLRLPRTQDRVVAALAGLGLEVGRGRTLSSVTAVLRGSARPALPRPAVVLRADMDALPVPEAADVPFRSDADGVMHACGHDLHTAMLVGAARLLAARRSELPGDVVLMFQPGEEGYDGARHMLDEGVLDAAGATVSAAYAVHVTSSLLPRGVVATRSGPLLAAGDGLFVTVRGRGGHGASPHLAADPIPAACEMVMALQTAMTRRLDPVRPAVLTVGRIWAGQERYVIPDEARFEATVRTVDPQARAAVAVLAREVCTGIAAAHGVEVDVRFETEYPLTVNDSAETERAREVAAALFGADRVLTLPNPLMASEDFARVLARVPGAMVLLGATAAGADPVAAAPNHSPRAVFDDAVVPAGAALLAGLAAARLRVAASG
ncbi:MAG TPA: M20 family metallopeptidase [Kineosporiaceae bacterium]